ncbi:histidine phosphotransferase family protein [Candidatus Trichorickettsia mobilis]|uniref:histidine phosphotransferase family protein n=1 Tax=Candidatus Trichorickettsia mobilis TaxID=1346319 RepID=UPI00292F219A|nr:histidine phosphotransferase family protein [Candidatus Trichorickettsia mobilis]
MKNQLLFSELLASKLCHDFAGIIGAVDSCTELLSSADVSIKNSALQLLSINSRKLVSRLKFYRYAYGNIDSLENININEIQMLSNQCLDLVSQQIILQLRSNLHHTMLDKLVGKIIICLIIIAFEHIIKNGQINCQLSMINNKLSIIVQAIGGYQKIDQQKANILLGNENWNNLNIHNCHEYYTYYLHQQTQCELLITQSTEMIQYSVQTTLEQK